jgi:hypothetical protein
MAEIDYVQILLGFLGGSGLVGLILTYFQMREERKEKARERLSNLVMTSELRRFLGSLGAQMDTLPEGLELVKKLLVAQADQKRSDEVARIKELLEWAREKLQSLKKARSRYLRIIDNGDFFLTPTEWRRDADKFMCSVADYIDRCKDIYHIGKRLGLLDAEQRAEPNLPIAEELQGALHRAEIALSNTKSLALALDLDVRRTLGLTILEK